MQNNQIIRYISKEKDEEIDLALEDVDWEYTKPTLEEMKEDDSQHFEKSDDPEDRELFKRLKYYKITISIEEVN